MANAKVWRRKAALHIAAQLPDDPTDALIVLEIASQVVREYWHQRQPQPSESFEQSNRIVPLQTRHKANPG